MDHTKVLNVLGISVTESLLLVLGLVNLNRDQVLHLWSGHAGVRSCRDSYGVVLVRDGLLEGVLGEADTVGVIVHTLKHVGLLLTSLLREEVTQTIMLEK